MARERPRTAATHAKETGDLPLARVVHTRWDSFCRTDVLEFRDEPDRKALNQRPDLWHGGVPWPSIGSDRA